MIKHYQTIIWGASVRAIQQAAIMQHKGTNVLLLNKLGFPGGDITEGLDCFLEYPLFTTPMGVKIKADAELFPRGVFMQNGKGILLHPESVKKSLWEFLTGCGADCLFHVVPLSVEKEKDYFKLNVFGKEGKMSFYCDNWYDFSDDKYLLRTIDSETIIPVSAYLNILYDRIPESISKFIPLPFKQLDSEEFSWLKIRLNEKKDDYNAEFNWVLGFVINTLYQKLNLKPLVIPYRPVLKFDDGKV